MIKAVELRLCQQIVEYAEHTFFVEDLKKAELIKLILKQRGCWNSAGFLQLYSVFEDPLQGWLKISVSYLRQTRRNQHNYPTLLLKQKEEIPSP